MPNQEAPNRLLVTGEVKLKLSNLFGTGKIFGFHWQQVRSASPLLRLEYQQPTLLRTRLQLKLAFDFLKQDTAFLSVNRRLALGYPLGNAGQVTAFANARSSRLGTPPAYRDGNALPDLADVRYASYGLGYEWNTLDDHLYPRRGILIRLEGEAGNKKVLRNPFLDPRLYEGITPVAPQLSLRAHAQRYVALSKKSVLVAGFGAAKLISRSLFGNDLYRLGGLSSLRGFNENFFYASQYALGTLEYRFFTDQASYLLLCLDGAWLAAQTVRRHIWDAPFGAGVGVNFRTGTGAFNLIYAMGRSKEQKFGLNFSKIHFGYTSLF